MMVGMKERYARQSPHAQLEASGLTKGFLLQKKEHGIDQLDVLGEVVQLENVSTRVCELQSCLNVRSTE